VVTSRARVPRLGASVLGAVGLALSAVSLSAVSLSAVSLSAVSLSAVSLSAVSLAAAAQPALSATPAPGPSALPRSETLYTSGTSSSPPTNFNPLSPGRYTGSQGLLYEPLFLYDPLNARFIPWLATGGSWVNSTTYRLAVRGGVEWVNSRSGAVQGTLSSRDVAYSIELAMTDKADTYHLDVASAQRVTATGATVTVSFAKPVGYAQWQEYLWHAPVVPEAVWSKLSGDGPLSASNTAPTATGPMLLDSVSPTEACFRTNPHWWGAAQMHLSFKFKYLCDVVSGPSGDELSDLLDDRIDWSNQLLRGVTNLADSKAGGYGIKTYYSGPPYMLPASTAWLQMDLARAPMNDVDFRRAVAYALDPAAIVSGVYTGTVETASPTGLLPELASFVDKNVVERYGFHYSPSLARRYLGKSGYKAQQLQLTVPAGWTDLVNAAGLICRQLAAVGIHVSTNIVPLRTRNADIADGRYDMVINDSSGLGSSPWTYFDDIYQLPLTATQGDGANTERDSAPADWALVQEAAATPLTDVTALNGIYANLELDFLQQLPEVPMWYTGAWFQANTQRWQNYPSSTDRRDQYTPVMWPGWLGSTTTIFALAELEPH
jgi:peptide/nickel transport system substrate-binding protein